MSKIMAVNAGSSSLKFQLILMPEEEVVTSGQVERIGYEDAIFTIKYNGKKDEVTLPVKDHGVAVKILLDALLEKNIVNDLKEINGVGHRIVQGGKYFDSSAIVTDEVENIVSDLADLAPLHNPAHLIGYHAFKEALPGVGHVMVFDTAFHQGMPMENYMYALPYEYYEKYAVRRYGAHGTSHLYVSQRCIEHLGNPEHSKIVTCHLGNGCSITAVKDGKSFKTSMGFTPLAGTVMGTRCGDIDPAIIAYLCEKLNVPASEISTIMNKKSGLLGISGISGDSRDIKKGIENTDPVISERCALAQKLQINSFVEIIASYITILGGCDAIVFTAGIGENDGDIRRMICEKLEPVFGTRLNETENKKRGEEVLISSEDSKVKIYVIPTNEEVMIARDTARLLNL